MILLLPIDSQGKWKIQQKVGRIFFKPTNQHYWVMISAIMGHMLLAIIFCPSAVG